MKPNITIEYCTQCRWMLRATWLLQELLTSFDQHIGQIGLIPGSGGVFCVKVDSTVVWNRSQDGALPELRVLKQRIRDLVAPEMSLGHTDRAASVQLSREAKPDSERNSQTGENRND